MLEIEKLRSIEEITIKKEGKKNWAEISRKNYELRASEVQQLVVDYDGKKDNHQRIKESEGNIDVMFEFLENEPKTPISKELPGDMYAVSEKTLSVSYFQTFAQIKILILL